MGFWDFVEAAVPWGVVEAEAPAAEVEDTDVSASEKTDDVVSSDDAPAEEEAAEEEAEEEEEEEEEDIVDPKETLEEECKNSKECAPAKHHFDECVERVTAAQDNGGTTEDCVEEFFHLAHCATSCAAPKLWATLK